MRRYVDLSRAVLTGMIALRTGPAYQECLKDLKSGAPFRMQADTVARESVLRVYALRAQATRIEGTPTVGVDEALKDLADTQIPRVRIGAVSGHDHDFVLFLDPDATYLIACFGVDS